MTLYTGLLTIDLHAIVANWERLQAYVSPGVACAAVVKADAYGLGVEQVCPVLYRQGCREFFFATTREAVRGRQFLPLDAQCYVLSGVAAGEEPLFAQHQLIPVLSNLNAIELWGRWRKTCGAPPGELPSVVKFDTGMTRLGLSAEDVSACMKSPQTLQRAAPVVLMSHLACADEPEHRQNLEQLKTFNERVKQLKTLLPEARLSLANSSGIFLGADYHADLVRPGAALYGFNPVPGRPNPMLAVVRLSLPVIQLRRVTHSAQVGYGASASVQAGQVLAVVSGGYADGLHRILGVEGVGMCETTRVPVVGRISMDTTVFDVSAVPSIHTKIKENMALHIDVINRQLTPSVLTQHTGALGYEVLTSLRAGRYRRRYTGAVGDRER